MTNTLLGRRVIQVEMRIPYMTSSVYIVQMARCSSLHCSMNDKIALISSMHCCMHGSIFLMQSFVSLHCIDITPDIAPCMAQHGSRNSLHSCTDILMTLHHAWLMQYCECLQPEAKRAVANALRNRWRRHKIASPMKVSTQCRILL